MEKLELAILANMLKAVVQTAFRSLLQFRFNTERAGYDAQFVEICAPAIASSIDDYRVTEALVREIIIEAMTNLNDEDSPWGANWSYQELPTNRVIDLIIEYGNIKQ